MEKIVSKIEMFALSSGQGVMGLLSPVVCITNSKRSILIVHLILEIL